MDFSYFTTGIQARKCKFAANTLTGMLDFRIKFLLYNPTTNHRPEKLFSIFIVCETASKFLHLMKKGCV